MPRKNRCAAAAFAVFLAAAPVLCAETNEQASFKSNEKGVRYLDQGRVKEAVRELERAHQLNPLNAVISQNLGVAYNNYGVMMMEDEKYLEAREYLELAASVDRKNKSARENLAMVNKKLGNAGAKAGARKSVSRGALESNSDLQLANEFMIQGVQYFEKKEYDLAEEVLLESVDISPTNPTAFEILGDIYYLQQDLKKAKENYTRAFKLRRSKNLEEKLEKVGREAGIEEKLDPYSDEHFIIRFKSDAESTFGGGFEIREYLRQAYRTVSQDFGYYPKEKVVILLYSEEEYRQLADTPEWTAGHFDGKIRLPAYKKKANPRDLQKLILHELTHFFVLNLSKGKCPTWLNEGLAQHEESKARPINVTYFKGAVKTKTLLSLEELEAGIEGAPANSVYLFYQQSYVMTQYLIKKYRMFKMKEMLQQYGKGRNTFQVFKDVLKMSPSTFEIKWLAELKNV